MVVSSKENQIKQFHESTTCDENKENEKDISKFSKLETDLKTYKTLVLELNKLSAEELNIRNKLFPSNKLKVYDIICHIFYNIHKYTLCLIILRKYL